MVDACCHWHVYVHVYLFKCKRHGGTPNLSAEARAIPCAGFTAPWFRPPTSSTQVTGRRFMLPEMMGAMSAAGRHACRDVALGEGEASEVQAWRPSWDSEAGVGGGGFHALRDGKTLPKL
jgi:hypothetical protein